MDYAKFVQDLPTLYEDWGKPSVRPKSPRLAGILSQVRGMTSVNVLELLNCAVRFLEEGEQYGEIGCFRGATLIGALIGHPEAHAIAVDNFSEFDRSGTNCQTLDQNLRAFDLDTQVTFRNQDFEDALRELRKDPPHFGVYLYDGAHDYRSQLMGLSLAAPLLAERALIVVDDSNAQAVKQATADFLACRPECRMLLELPTPGNRHSSFWNGLMLLAWDAKKLSSEEARPVRQEELLRSLKVLQGMNIARDGNQLTITPLPDGG
ncbi:MAG: class I SAM-dependent methyltransferase [Planctomycetes bacterium]|nr:class I SAM-dependent methyltransferase [Planctomycetota bacterium]